jgi:hypothetical protein
VAVFLDVPVDWRSAIASHAICLKTTEILAAGCRTLQGRSEQSMLCGRVPVERWGGCADPVAQRGRLIDKDAAVEATDTRASKGPYQVEVGRIAHSSAGPSVCSPRSHLSLGPLFEGGLAGMGYIGSKALPGAVLA